MIALLSHKLLFELINLYFWNKNLFGPQLLICFFNSCQNIVGPHLIVQTKKIKNMSRSSSCLYVKVNRLACNIVTDSHTL